MAKDNRGGKRPNQTGRPKSEPYKSITFRAEVVDIEAAKAKHGRELNKMFKEWLKQVIT